MRLLDGDVARIATRLGGPDERAARAGTADLDVSVESWLDGVSPPELGRDAMLAFAAAMGGGRPAELGILPLVLDAIDNGYDLDAGWADIGVSFIGGTRRLVEAISAGLDIRLSSVVARVEQGDDGVTVRLEGGEKVEAMAAVVTLPLNVWRDVEFDPPLAGGKAAAREAGHPGRSSKVLAIARNVPDGFAGGGWGTELNALVDGDVAGGQLLAGFRRWSWSTRRPCGRRRGAGVHPRPDVAARRPRLEHEPLLPVASGQCGPPVCTGRSSG
jgi:hypothetical protein